MAGRVVVVPSPHSLPSPLPLPLRRRLVELPSGSQEREGKMREMLGPPRRGPAYKTKLCSLWKRGSCSRASCSFAHGDGELRRPPSNSSFLPHPRPGCGGRDHRNHDLRGRAERRHSPRGRYSPGRDTRGHLFRDQRPRSKERGSSYSRSPIRKGERRERKKLDGGNTDSSGSLDTSDKEDRKKDDRFSSSDEKDNNEAQLKQSQLDMETLCEDKSKLEMILNKKIDEACILSTRIDDLESQLNKEKEDCQRMTSKVKKLIRAHGCYVKAQDDLKRSQARFERFADLLASDTLKSGTKEQGSSGNAGNEDPYNAYEMSPSDQRHNHVSTARRRSIALSTSEEEKTGKKRRVSNDDMIPVSKKYRPEDALESLRNSKGTDTPKSLYVKKLGEGDNNEEGNVFSSSNVFADRYKGGDDDVLVD